MGLADWVEAGWSLLGTCACGCDECTDAEVVSEGAMDPFKRKAKIGPGPYGRRNQKRRADRFRCRCKGTSVGTLCKCRSRRGIKTVFVDASYKQSYNAVYRAWQKKRKARKKKAKPFAVQAQK